MLVFEFLDLICFQTFIPETKGYALKDSMPTSNKRKFSLKKELLPLSRKKEKNVEG